MMVDSAAATAVTAVTSGIVLAAFALHLGASNAVIGLLAVMVRDTPLNAVALSHHVFQVRTLWTAAVVAVLGVILIVVNAGVFVLFLLVLFVNLLGDGVRDITAPEGRA